MSPPAQTRRRRRMAAVPPMPPAKKAFVTATPIFTSAGVLDRTDLRRVLEARVLLSLAGADLAGVPGTERALALVDRAAGVLAAVGL